MDEAHLTNEQRLELRRQDYLAVFGNEAGERVLKDLGVFAHINEPAYVKDDPNGRHSAMVAGMQKVVMRIKAYLTLEPQGAPPTEETYDV